MTSLSRQRLRGCTIAGVYVLPVLSIDEGTLLMPKLSVHMSLKLVDGNSNSCKVHRCELDSHSPRVINVWSFQTGQSQTSITYPAVTFKLLYLVAGYCFKWVITTSSDKLNIWDGFWRMLPLRFIATLNLHDMHARKVA